MADDYRSFYLKDLVQIIEHTALDLMSAPMLGWKRHDGTYMTVAEVVNRNSMIAMENSGIKMMATALLEQLTGAGKGDDPGG